MYKFSFKVRHKGCFETRFSATFPDYYITVVDIQSTHPRKKQYFYYITGNPKKFSLIVKYLKKSKGYTLVREIEHSNETLMLLVVLNQSSYIQNAIQKQHGFLIELHAVYGGWEYWHIGVVDKSAISIMLKEFKKMGELKIIYIGEVEFANTLLSKQQRKVIMYAYEQGYYELPRKITMKQIAKALKLNHSTLGEHLLKAENKLINSMAKKL